MRHIGSRSPRATVVTAALAALLASCRRGDDCGIASLGSEHSPVAAAGSCANGRRLEIRCVVGPLPRACQCIADGVAGRTFSLGERTLGGFGQAERVAAAHCGWSMRPR